MFADNDAEAVAMQALSLCVNGMIQYKCICSHQTNWSFPLTDPSASSHAARTGQSGEVSLVFHVIIASLENKVQAEGTWHRLPSTAGRHSASTRAYYPNLQSLQDS